MTLSIDTTPAGTDANSYNTIQEADNYFESDLAFNPIWTALTEEEKKAKLIFSTRGIDRNNFISRKYRDFSFDTNEQNLEFPRLSDIRIDEIHPRIKKAQLEMLKYIHFNSDESTGETTIKNEIVSVNVSQVVSVGFKPYKSIESKESAQAVGSSLEAVDNLLRPWLTDDPYGSGSFNWVK